MLHLETVLVVTRHRGSLEKALLHDMLRSKADGKVDLVKLYKTLLDIAAGMQYLHSANILHGGVFMWPGPAMV